jgi:hypothetical protein
MQLSKKEIKHLENAVKKEDRVRKTDPEYENSLKDVEKILKRRSRKKR